MNAGETERLTGFRRSDMWAIGIACFVAIVAVCVWSLVAEPAKRGPADSSAVPSLLLIALAIIVAAGAFGELISLRILEHRWPWPISRGEPRRCRNRSSAATLFGVFGGGIASNIVRDFGARPDALSNGSGYLVFDAGSHVTVVTSIQPMLISLVGWVGGYAIAMILGLAIVAAWNAAHDPYGAAVDTSRA
jgi:hypothetical protein